jgi:hypothetical protein
VFTVVASAHIQFRSFAVEAATNEAGILLDGMDVVTPSNPPPGQKNPIGAAASKNVLRVGVFDVTIEDLVMTGAKAPAILAVRVTGLLARCNRILMKNEQSNWPAAFFSGKQIWIEENLVTIQAAGTVRDFLPATVVNDLDLGSGDFGSGFLHPGGIQIGGPSDLVYVTANEIAGGSRNGITLGSLTVIDSNNNNLGGWWGVVVEGGDKCCTGSLVITGTGPGTGETYANAGLLEEIFIERNLIVSMGLCGIGPVAWFNTASQYEVISIDTLSIVENTIVETVQRAIDTTDSTQTTSMMGIGAVTIPDASSLTIRDNTIQDFGQSPGVQVSGIFVLLCEGIEVSRNQITETRDWSGSTTENANSSILSGGIVILFAMPPEANGDTILAGNPVYELGVSSVRIAENTVRVAVGQALVLFSLGPTAIVNNHFATGGLVANSSLQLAQTVLVMNLGKGNDLSDLGNAQPSYIAGMAQGNSNEFLSTGGNPFADITNGTVLFTNNVCQLEARAGGQSEITSVLIFSPDSLIFSNNATWLDAANLSAFSDVLLLAATVQVIGNRLQEPIGSVLVSGITIGVANITSHNIATNCLLAIAPRRVATGNLVLVEAISEDFCKRGLESTGLGKWAVASG